MTFDEEMDTYDPLIAERFELLDRVTPTDMGHPGNQVRHQTAAPTMLAPRVESRVELASRQLYLLAAAAAMVTVAGASVFALNRTGNEPDLQASDGGDVQVQVDDDNNASMVDDDADSESLTVELPVTTVGQASTDAAAESAGQADPADGDAEQAAAEGADTGSSAGTSDSVSEAGSQGTIGGSQETTDTTQPASTESTTTTVVATETSPPETPPTTATESTEVTAAPTTELTPDSSWLNPPTAEKMITIRGKVTEVFTDCQSRMILNDQGEVESVGPISCDGGSYIIVGGKRIQTASGYLMSESDMYGKHIASLLPGRMVSVTAVPTASAGGLLTLDCALCKIKLEG
ncbi:MAG: hypothetical protein ACRBK7_00930 [Acidimicrobiales bacterium]